jgi:hypothetical protein
MIQSTEPGAIWCMIRGHAPDPGASPGAARPEAHRADSLRRCGSLMHLVKAGQHSCCSMLNSYCSMPTTLPARTTTPGSLRLTYGHGSHGGHGSHFGMGRARLVMGVTSRSCQVTGPVRQTRLGSEEVALRPVYAPSTPQS